MDRQSLYNPTRPELPKQHLLNSFFFYQHPISESKRPKNHELLLFSCLMVGLWQAETSIFFILLRCECLKQRIWPSPCIHAKQETQKGFMQSHRTLCLSSYLLISLERCVNTTTSEGGREIIKKYTSNGQAARLAAAESSSHRWALAKVK